MSRRRRGSSSSDEDLDSFHISAYERGDLDLLDDEDGHDVLLGSRLEEELNCSIEKMREEEAVPIARLIRLEGSLGSSSQGSSNNSPHPIVMESAAAHLSGTLELLEDVEMPSLSLCESAELVSLVSISPNSPVKMGFSFKDDGTANGTFVAKEKRGDVYSVSSSNFRKQPPTEEFDIADKIAMLSAIPSTSLSVNTLVSLDEKEASQTEARRMTLDQTKSFSGAFLAEACGIVEELDGLAANMTSSPLASPERRVSPDRRLTIGPDMDLLDMENMNDSLLSSLAIANSPVKKLAVSAIPSPLSGHEVKKDVAQPVSVKAVDCTYDRLAQLLNETQDVVSKPAAPALERADDVKSRAVNSTFMQSNNQKLLNSTFDREQPPTEQKLTKNPHPNATFNQKHINAANNQTFDRMEHQAAANTTFEMIENNFMNTTFDRKENQQANTTFDFQGATEGKNENLNVTFEKGEYRIHSMNETVNLMDAEGDVLKLILDSTPKKSGKAVPEAASTPKGAAKPQQTASKGTITKDPTQSFLHRMSLNLRNDPAKAVATDNSQQSAAEPHSHIQALSNRNTVPGFKMGHLDHHTVSNQLRRLHNPPTAMRSISGPMRALPMHAFPIQQKQMENASTPDDEGITALDYNSPVEVFAKDTKPAFGSQSSIDNERPCTPDLGIAMDHRTSTPDVFRPGDPGSGPRITSTPAMRGGVFSRMVGMDGPAPTPIIAPVSRHQRVVSVASTGSLPEVSQDPRWPGLSHESTKDSKGGLGTPANHHSGRAIQALKLNHQNQDKLNADANEGDVQDRKHDPQFQNEDVDKVISSLDTNTGKEVEKKSIVDSPRDIQDNEMKGDINEQLPTAQDNAQQACDGLSAEMVRNELSTELIKDCQQLLNTTLDMQPSTKVRDDASQPANNEHVINVEEPNVLRDKNSSETTNLSQPESSSNMTRPVVDIANCEVRDYEKQADMAGITESSANSGLKMKANCEASAASEHDLPLNLNEENQNHNTVHQMVQSVKAEVCLNDTFEAEQSDSSAKIKTEVCDVQQETIPVAETNSSQGHGKDNCVQRKVNNSQVVERPRPKRNISAESNESCNSGGESHTSTDMNAEPNRQIKLKGSSFTQARKVPTPVSSARSNVKAVKKLDTSKNSTSSNTSFSKADQKPQLKKNIAKVDGGRSRSIVADSKNSQAIIKPALGKHRSLPHSSPSQRSNNSFTKSDKENTPSKQVDKSTKPPESQTKSRLSLAKGINPTKRPVLGSSNIQIRKSIVAQPDKQKSGLGITKNAPLKANIGITDKAKCNDSSESLKQRGKLNQSNSKDLQDLKSKTTNTGRLKPPSKRMKPSSPIKSPQKIEAKQSQQLPQPTQKIATGSHTGKLARPQLTSGLQPPSTNTKVSSVGNSAVSKLPGLRPPSSVKPVTARRVSGIVPPTLNKPSALRLPRPVAR